MRHTPTATAAGPHPDRRDPKAPRAPLGPFAAGLAVLLLALVPACQAPRSAGEIRASAEAAYDAGEYEKALAEWEAYAEVYPVPLKADLGRARALLALDRPLEAAEILERVHRADPRDEEKLELLIDALFAADAHGRLIELLRERTRQPGRVADFLRLGRYAQLLGDPDEAERALLAAARIDRGQSVEPQRALAAFYHEIGDTQAALERYAMALWFDYTDPEIAERIRSLGETPGRTFVRPPAEAVREGLLGPDAPPPPPPPTR